MCVGAALLGGVNTAGAALAFNVGLGLTVANAFVGRAAAKSRADQTYNQALIKKYNHIKIYLQEILKLYKLIGL